ncbi:hypothetical protein LUZ60_003570 [Juncus effusus]|nr:hypothetical protein LUZ60_003570 [Juncus effusus]
MDMDGYCRPRTHDPLAADSWFRNKICCDKLKELSLVECGLRPESVSSLILQSCSSLEMVCLDRCDDLYDSGLISLSEKSRGLKNISLKSFSVTYLTETSFKALSRNCPSLENVEFAVPSVRSFPEWAPSITIDAILALTNSCLIRALVLKNVDFLSGSAMDALSLASPRLETLEIKRARRLTDLGIRFVNNFPRLVNLLIIRRHRITDDGLKPLIETKKLDCLKTIVVSPSKVCKGC